MASHREIFSESEAGEIVQRAVELQETTRAQEYTPGVTREELAKIASEVGIDMDYLEQAIRERFNPPAKKGLGSVFPQPVERVTEGELHPEDYDLLAEELPTRASQAPPSQVGRTLSAKVMSGLTMADVSITARNGRTRVKVSPLPILPLIFGGQMALIGTIVGSSMIAENGPLAVGVAVIAAGLAGGLSLGLYGLRQAKSVAQRLAEKLIRRIDEEATRKAVEEAEKAKEAPSS
ncbi:MAG: hypothetical protein KIT11_00360 [Fimbriimonadaceae bacterium]|nr:hypothetical protein [Fimbriimonadaceae bacterium]QYK55175.1 MAG: hypothetical protein KF733_09175 [Fimbriimonadaceae bacterium]